MTEKRNCNQCGKEYEPKYYTIGDTDMETHSAIHILVGQGNCPDCAQKEYDKEVAKEKAEQQASIMGARRKRREECGIPSKFMNHDFSTFEKGWQNEAYKKCVAYSESFPVDRRPIDYPSLYIYSETSWGVGKTHLSCAIAHRIFDRWKGEREVCPRVVFISEPDLFRKIQATFNYSSEEKRYRESEDDIIKSLTWCDLLILDDVGKEKRRDMDFVQRTLFAIIDGRYKASLPMVLTANLYPAELKRHLGSASFDRFVEQTKGKAVVMDGKSYRRK